MAPGQLKAIPCCAVVLLGGCIDAAQSLDPGRAQPDAGLGSTDAGPASVDGGQAGCVVYDTDSFRANEGLEPALFPVVSDQVVYYSATAPASPGSDILVRGVFRFGIDDGVTRLTSPLAEQHLLIDAAADRLLLQHNTDGIVLLADERLERIDDGRAQTGWEQRNRWLTAATDGYLRQGTAIVRSDGIFRLTFPDSTHLTLKDRDAYIVRTTPDGTTISEWSLASPEPVLNLFVEFPDADAPIEALGVTDDWVYWSMGRQIRRARRATGLVEVVYESQTPCFFSDAEGSTALFACGAADPFEPLGQVWLLFRDDAAVVEFQPDGWIARPQLLTEDEVIWLEYESPNVLCMPTDAPAGVVRVRDVRDGVVVTLADIDGPCLCCGAYWPFPWLDAQDGVAVWNYPRTSTRFEAQQHLGYVVRSEDCR